jgi:hypothetical protein
MTRLAWLTFLSSKRSYSQKSSQESLNIYIYIQTEKSYRAGKELFLRDCPSQKREPKALKMQKLSQYQVGKIDQHRLTILSPLIRHVGNTLLQLSIGSVLMQSKSAVSGLCPLSPLWLASGMKRRLISLLVGGRGVIVLGLRSAPNYMSSDSLLAHKLVIWSVDSTAPGVCFCWQTLTKRFICTPLCTYQCSDC